jgi:hypothetical protein
VELAGGKVFPAHKQILACASPVLYTRVITEVEEGTTARIVIKAEADLVEMFKRYIYTQDDSILGQLSTVQLMELYRLSYEYEVWSLSNACSEVLAQNMHSSTVANLMQLSIIAEAYNDTHLKNECVRIVRTNSKALMCNEDCVWFMTQYPWIFEALNRIPSAQSTTECLLLPDADGSLIPCRIKDLRADQPNTAHLRALLIDRDDDLRVHKRELDSCKDGLWACRKELASCKKELESCRR